MNIYEFGSLVDKTHFGWAYLLKIERETAKTRYGSRARIDPDNGKEEWISGTKFSIKKNEDIDQVTYHPQYKSDGFYLVRVQAVSFEEAKTKAKKLLSSHFEQLAKKIAESQ